MSDCANSNVIVAALYKFTRVDDPEGLRSRLHGVCEAEGIAGTLLIASEGLNGTIAGSRVAIDRVLSSIRREPGFSDIEHKEACVQDAPFRRLRVRIRPEIVTIGREGVDPTRTVGRYVEPDAWNALIDDPDVLLIDARNSYEVRIGQFEGAVDPETESFSALPDWMDRQISEWVARHGKSPKIAMYCTGGIRCEKASSYLTAQGHQNVFHLKGGILKYLETVPEENSTWRGDCFVFDERVSVRHGLVEGAYVQCFGCGEPVSKDEQTSSTYEPGVSCPHCVDRLTDDRRAMLAARQRQFRQSS